MQAVGCTSQKKCPSWRRAFQEFLDLLLSLTRRREQKTNASSLLVSWFSPSDFLQAGRIKTLKACYDNDSSQSNRNTGNWPGATCLTSTLQFYRDSHPHPLHQPALMQVRETVQLGRMFPFDNMRSQGKQQPTDKVKYICGHVEEIKCAFKDFLDAAPHGLDYVCKTFMTRKCCQDKTLD